MTFHVGQKVQCVSEDWDEEIQPFEVFPKDGDVLTIRTLEQDADGTYFRFHEIVNPIVDYDDESGECVFSSENFRPLQESGMSILRSIAANPKQKVDA